MEIGHVLYRASRVQKDNEVIRIYGQEPLNRTLEVERIIGMNLCYSVLDGGATVPFCFVDRRKAYVFRKNGNSRNPLFNFPSIFQGEFIVKDKIPEFPSLGHLLYLTGESIAELGNGGSLVGPDVEIQIPKFKTLNEFKMKMELSSI